MYYQFSKFMWFAAAASLAVALSGCGGGGSTVMSPMTPTTDDGTTMMPGDGGTGPSDRSTGVGRLEILPEVISPTAQIHAAALASPVPGSVTQGSAVLQGVTTDTVNVSFTPYDDGVHPIASISIAGEGTLTSNDDPMRMEVHLPSGEIVYIDPANEMPPEEALSFLQEVYSPAEWGENFFSQEFEERWGLNGGGYSCYEGSDCAEMEKRLEEISLENYLDHPVEGRSIQGILLLDSLGGGSFGANEDGSTWVIGNPSGISVIGFTDYQSGESNYLAWGNWSYYKFTPSDLELTYGAFADGGVETAFADVPIVGTASYSGYSHGIAAKGASPSRDDLESFLNFDFIGEVSLAADFGTASITGSVDNFRAIYVYDDPSTALINEALGNDGFLNGLEILLGSADIRSSGSNPEHSFFEGAASVIGDDDVAGRWGGQFFGTSGAGEPPPAVGGTWGVTEGEGADDWKMLGGFGAWNEALPGEGAMTTDMAEAAARNAPNPGSGAQSSVTQSSNASNGMTTDSVTTMVEYDNGQINFMVNNGSTWSISDDDTVLARPSGTSSGVEFDGVELKKSLAGGTLWVDVYSTIEPPTTETVSGVPYDVQSGDQIVGLSCLGSSCSAETMQGTLNDVQGTFTCPGSCSIQFGGITLYSGSGKIDFTGATFNGLTVGVDTFAVASAMGIVFTSEATTTQTVIDADYLSLGYWVYVPNGKTDVTDWQYGAFVDGSDPFDDSILRGVTSSATYRGPAAGMVINADETEEAYWVAAATLTADFGTSSQLGTIRGSVQDFVIEDVPEDALSVTLESAPIGGSNNGFFTGNAGFTYRGVTDSDAGQWGGRFFGNGETDGKPGSVAGTFGVSDGNGESLLGFFGAQKQ